MTLYPTGGGGGGGGVTSLTAGQGISVSGATGAVTVSQATFTLTDGQDYVAFADDDSSALIDLIDGGASHGSQILFGNGASPGNVHVIQAFLDAGGIITFYAHDGAPAFHVADNSPSGGATVSTQGNTLDDGSNNHLAAFLKSITIGSTTPAATGTTEGLNFITGAAPHHISLVPTADNTADYTITLPNANGTVALTGGAVAWSSLTAPATALSLTMPAADTTTFTLQQTTQTGFTWTSSTLTSGALAALGLTGSSSFSGTLLAITSTSTGATGTVNWNSIAISGTPSASGVVSRGLEIVMSGAGTTSTNVGLYLSAANATTANTALEIAAGQILSDAAQTWAVNSATASSLQITDGTNPYLVIDTRTTTSGVSAITFEGSAPTITSAAGVTFSGINDPAYTLTLTGTTTVTALNGLQHYIGQPTVTDSSAVTVTTASTLYIAGAPAVSGSATITNPYAIHVAAGAVNFAGGSVAFNPKTDATYGLGTSALRWNSVGVATEFDVWGAASDANPAVSIQNAYIGFGPGGASALDTFLNR